MVWQCKNGHKFNKPNWEANFWDKWPVCPICKSKDITEEPLTEFCNYKCNNCGFEFSEPKQKKKGGRSICVCPKCGSQNIVS